MRISWIETVSNEEVLQRIGIKRQLLDTIRKRQRKFVGHLLREEDGMERYIIETEMAGERARE